MYLCLPLRALVRGDEPDYLQLNEDLKTLEQFKDTPEMLRAKLKQLDNINNYRRGYHARPLKLDILASRVANMQSYNAAVNDYTGHWDLNGYKPYIRYALAGGRDHDSENASAEWGSGQTLAGMDDTEQALRKMKSGLDNFMAEGDGGGHHDNIVEAAHNYVGLGYFITNFLDSYQLRYYEEYIDRYISWDDFPMQAAPDQELTVSGRVIPEDTGVYAVLIYYEPLPSPMHPSQIRAKGSYPDYTSDLYQKFWAWKITFDADTRSFQVKTSFKKRGFYYVQVYLKNGISSIPYDRPAAVSTEGLANASGVVIRVED
jgi:hypothetical protein